MPCTIAPSALATALYTDISEFPVCGTQRLSQLWLAVEVGAATVAADAPALGTVSDRTGHHCRQEH